MIMLALGDYVKYLRRNIFIAIQISVLLLVTTIMISSLYEQYRYYKPFAEFSSNSGFTLMGSGFHPDSFDALTKGIKTKGVVTYGTSSLSYTEGEYYTALVYPDDLLQKFSPTLQSGKWLDKNSEDIDIIVSQNDQGWKTGDTITLAYPSEQGDVKFDAYIKGMVQEGSAVIGRGVGESGGIQNDYRDIYSVYRYEQEEEPIIMISESSLSKIGGKSDCGQIYVVAYEDGVTADEIKENETTYQKNIQEFSYGGNVSLEEGDLKNFIEGSKKEVNRNILMYIPLFICMLIVTMISLINVCSLNMRESFRQNAVFYLLGLHWKRCGLFSFIQSMFTAAISVMLFSLYINLIYLFNLKKYVLVEIQSFTIMWLALEIGVLLIIALLIPWFMLKKKTPLQVLKQEKL